MLAEHSLSRQIVSMRNCSGILSQNPETLRLPEEWGMGEVGGDYRWLAWAEDKKGASCDLTLKGWGERMLER